MSSAELTMVVQVQESDSSTPILDALLAQGWQLGEADGASISYLGLDDEGLYDWQSAPLSNRAAVLEVLRSRARAGKVVGVSIVWNGSPVGGMCRISEPEVLRFDPDINRQTVEGCTDVNWYLSRMLAVDGSRGIQVLNWTWSEEWS